MPRLSSYVLALQALLPALAAAAADIRVARGLGAHGSSARISVVDGSPAETYGGFFPYNAGFKHRWANFSLHSVLKTGLAPGSATTFAIPGAGNVTVRVPADGAPVRGIVFGDPCVFITDLTLGCEGSVGEHLPPLLNAVARRGAGIDFWAMLGDNFYDRTGHNSAKFFSQLAPEVKSSFLLTVPGNHDYWIAGQPALENDGDQYGNGFMQYYGQDCMAGKADTTNFLDFSVAPGKPAAPGNFFFYHTIGDVGFIGYPGAYEWAALDAYFQEACAYFGANRPAWLWLLGHWSSANDGCPEGMDVPTLYKRIRQIPGCDMPGFFNMYGHSHVNKKISDVEYLIGATGFLAEDNGPGFVYLSTHQPGRQLIVNFNFDATHYKALQACLDQADIDDCVHLGTVWYNGTAV